MSETIFADFQIEGFPTEEERLFALAVHFFNQADDSEASALFQRVFALHGTKATDASEYLKLIEARCDELPFARGVHLWQRKRYKSAHQHFQKVVNLGRSHSDEALAYIQDINGRRERRRLRRLTYDFKDRRFWGDSTSSLPEISSRDSRPEIPPFSSAYDEDAEVESQREAVVRRTPHLDVAPGRHAKPGGRLLVIVYVDKAAPHEGEEAEEIELEARHDISTFELKVTLFPTEHFTLEGEQVKPLVIERDVESSDFVTFSVRVKSEVELREKNLLDYAPVLTALFTDKGRPCGKVSRRVSLVLEGDVAESLRAGVKASEEVSADQGRLRIDNAKKADLQVTIVADESGDERKFYCTVQTHLIHKYADGVPGRWPLPELAPSLIKRYMRAFEDEELTNRERIASLRGSGKELFLASPQIFQDVFWELHDCGKLPRTISIVSAEPYMPWEVMIPARRINGMIDSGDNPLPLGATFVVGRWPVHDSTGAEQRLKLTDSFLITPEYKPKEKLDWAEDEARFVLERFPGQKIAPATFDNLEDTFKTGGRTLIHFACHGEEDEYGGQVILLDDGRPLPTSTLRGAAAVVKALREKRPFVFLNACEIGRGAPSLVGVGGFAQTFIDLGARAVIAPLWSVKDDIAHQIAVEFYSRVCNEPELPFAEILRVMRARAYDLESGEDTYAAYCFYGDPLASREYSS